MVRCVALIVCISVAMSGLAGCANAKTDPPVSTPTPSKQELVVYGPIGLELGLDAFQTIFVTSELPYKIRVFQGSSTEAGVRGLLNGTFDLALLMRRPRPDELLAFMEFARTSVAIFVHPDSGIRNLTRTQVAAIFSGAITHWSEVGGADQEIVVFIQESDDITTLAMRDYILGGEEFVAEAPVLISETDVLVVVEGTPGAIGYAALSGKLFLEFVSPTAYLDPIMLDGKSPSDPEYSFVSSIGLAFLPDRVDDLQPLFEWGNDLFASDMIQPFIKRIGVQVVVEPEIAMP